MHNLRKSILLEGSGELWVQATQSSFLSAIQDGSLPAEAFRRWLEQDYLFAQGLTSFQAVATAKMPRTPQKLLIAGLAALDAEMDWFEMKAEERNIDLRTSPHPICQRYLDFLISSAYTEPFEVLLAILYGVEASYLAAWSALNAEGPYAEYIRRWSNEPFGTYVQGLEEQTVQYPHPDQQERFERVLRHEKDFWRMTWES